MFSLSRLQSEKQKQKRRLAAKVEQEHLVMASMPELAVKILDYARDHGRVTMSDVLLTTGASRNTLKEHFRSLVAKRHLVQRGVGKATWYSLT